MAHTQPAASDVHGVPRACIAGNNALLQVFGESIWFKDLNAPELVPMVFDYAEAMLAANEYVPPPEDLREHVYDRYFVPGRTPDHGEQDGLARLDPVCLMDVDPATAKFTAEYGGRVIAFCAPSCRKLSLADPEAYLVG